MARGSKKRRPMSEINVVPYIDVMLWTIYGVMSKNNNRKNVFFEENCEYFGKYRL